MIALYGGKTAKELEALADAAAKGPWLAATRCDETICYRFIFSISAGPTPTNLVVRAYGDNRSDDDNIAFIVAARSAVPALLAEIRRLEKQCRGLADAAANNGRDLLSFERALVDISKSKNGGEAIQIAEDALKPRPATSPAFGNEPAALLEEKCPDL